MAINAEQLNIILAARDKEFTKAMERSQRRVEMFAKQSNKNLSKTTRGFNTLNTAAKGLLPSLGVAAVVGGLARMANAVGEMARNITNLSSVAGIGIEQFQEMAFAADRVGISQEKFADILKDVNDKIGDFLSTGAGPMKDFFEQIAPQVGVTAEQFRNLNSADALQLYVSSLEKANLSQAEMTFYMEAIASDATALLPLLRDNGQEMTRLGEAARSAGKVIDETMIASAVNAQETWAIAIAKLQGMFMGLAVHVANSFDEVFGITPSGQANQIEAIISKRQEDIIRAGEELQAAQEIGHTGMVKKITDEILTMNAEVSRLQRQLEVLRGTAQPFGPPAPPPKAPLSSPGLSGPAGASGAVSAIPQIQAAVQASNELAKSGREIIKEMDTASTSVSGFGASASEASFDVVTLTSEAEKLSSIGSTLESSMERAFMSMLDGTATAQDAFRAMAKDIISELYRVLVVQELVGKFETGGGGILGGIFSAFSGRASGGSVHAGSPYMVGENGPEPFVPAQNGRILSTSQAKAAIGGGGGGVVINQSISVNQGGQNIPPERLFREIRVAATDAVADAMQRGGGFRGVMS